MPRSNVHSPCSNVHSPCSNVHRPCYNVHSPCSNVHSPWTRYIRTWTMYIRTLEQQNLINKHKPKQEGTICTCPLIEDCSFSIAKHFDTVCPNEHGPSLTDLTTWIRSRYETFMNALLKLFFMHRNFICIHSGASLLGTTPCSRKWFTPTDSESRGLLYKAGRRASRHSVTVTLNVRVGKTSDLSNVERGMIVT